MYNASNHKTGQFVQLFCNPRSGMAVSVPSVPVQPSLLAWNWLQYTRMPRMHVLCGIQHRAVPSTITINI